MANWNTLPDVTPPLTSDKVFAVRGTAVGAECKLTLLAIQALFKTSYDTVYSPLAGSASITTLGTIATGVWNGTAIGDTYISSAATWNAKQTAGAYVTSLTGDVSGTGPGAAVTTIANGVVTLAKMAQLSANSIIGNNVNGSATPTALSVAQVRTFLGLQTVATSGAYGDLSGRPSLAAVATSGNFDDLSNKPTIDSLQVGFWGAGVKGAIDYGPYYDHRVSIWFDSGAGQFRIGVDGDYVGWGFITRN